MALMARSKIFGVGLNKTGTTSLHHALQTLGFRSTHATLGIRQIARCDALVGPYAACYFDALDLQFPGSKFVLTVRDPESWIASVSHQWQYNDPSHRGGMGAEPEHMVTLMYGSLAFDAELYLAKYHLHESRVRGYFADRPGDLFVLDITAADRQWPDLCRFLGVGAPKGSFPHAHKAANMGPVLARLRESVGCAEKVASIAGVSPALVREAKAQPLTALPGSKGLDRLVNRVCKRLGGTAAGAQALKLSYLAVFRARLRHRWRKKTQREPLAIMN